MTSVTDVYAAIHESLKKGESVCVATVIGTEGSTPRGVGSKMILWMDGRTLGSVGGGPLELKVQESADEVFRTGRPARVSMSLKSELDPGICGGEAEVFVELLTGKPPLIVVGGGHVGRALSQLASLLGFRVVVMDRRELDRALFPESVETVRVEGWAHLPQEHFSAQAYAAIMTPEHEGDRDALAQMLDRPLAYLGMIGSRRKVALTFDYFRQQGVPEEALARVHAPIGLDIGAETPMEIAVSIIAEIIQVRNAQQAGGAGNARSGLSMKTMHSRGD